MNHLSVRGLWDTTALNHFCLIYLLCFQCCVVQSKDILRRPIKSSVWIKVVDWPMLNKQPLEWQFNCTIKMGAMCKCSVKMNYTSRPCENETRQYFNTNFKKTSMTRYDLKIDLFNQKSQNAKQCRSILKCYYQSSCNECITNELTYAVQATNM